MPPSWINVDRRIPVVAAIEGAARLLEAGWGADLKQEERLRRAVMVCALERLDVHEVLKEWKPQPALKRWRHVKGSPLGGFDLAFRMKGDGGVTVVAETKWSGGTGPDALDQTPWDALKLLHARATIREIRWALLITAAPTGAWETARYARVFGGSTTSILEFLQLNPRMYAEDSKSRPLALPPYVQSSPTTRVAFDLAAKEWEIRVASVCANGEPWLDCDEEGWPQPTAEKPVMDWPHPEPGLGMMDDDLVLEQGTTAIGVPGPDATWAQITRFGSEVDGYRSHGNALGDLANASVEFFRRNGSIDPTIALDDLRACLFFETRRYHHFGHAPGMDDTPYIRALVLAIATASNE
jgi:hypothetical protein